MSSSAAAAKLKIDEVLNSAVRKKEAVKTAAVTDTKAFENIAANAFYKIVFDEKTKPEEKKAAIIKALTFEGTKEEMRARLAEYFALEEYLQNVREEMAGEIIRITDTEAFSELKSVYDEMNNSLIDYDNKMKPLTDILDALYTLRTEGKTLDIFKEIQEDKSKEAETNAKKAEIARTLSQVKNSIEDIHIDNLKLGNEKTLFGFGGLKADAKAKIAQNEYALQENEKKLDDLQKNLQSLQAAQNADGQFAVEKSKLRELLDISTDDHKQRQADLVQAALTFVKTAKERIGAVRAHLGGMDQQIEKLYDANGNMLSVYTILGEGIKGAEVENQKVRDGLSTGAEGEDAISKLTREQKKAAVEQHITAMDQAATATMSTTADLTSQSIRIKTMKDANTQQIAKARTMHSQGVAGVADRLSVVLQAVSSAALGESSAMAKETLATMAASTNQLAQKESIKVAMGITETNEDLAKAIDDLGAYGEVIKTATNISREGVKEMRSKLDELADLAKGVQGDINDAVAVNADVSQSSRTGKFTAKDTVATKVPETPGLKNPFA